MFLNCSASEASTNASKSKSINFTVKQEKKAQRHVRHDNCTHHSSAITEHRFSETTTQSRCLTSHTSPTKDAPWLTKHSTHEHSAPCTHDHHATVASAPSQNLDMGTWSGARTNSAWNQPAFKHCWQHHLMPGFVFGFFWGVVVSPPPSPLGFCCFKLSE